MIKHDTGPKRAGHLATPVPPPRGLGTRTGSSWQPHCHRLLPRSLWHSLHMTCSCARRQKSCSFVSCTTVRAYEPHGTMCLCAPSSPCAILSHVCTAPRASWWGVSYTAPGHPATLPHHCIHSSHFRISPLYRSGTFCHAHVQLCMLNACTRSTSSMQLDSRLLLQRP